VSAERLRVVECAELAGRTVISRSDDRQVGPLFFGPGTANLLCGACTFLLIRGAWGAHSIRDVVVKCPNCGACNQGGHAAVAQDGVGEGVDEGPRELAPEG
jgi:phage FluMu protein Com